MNSTGKYVKFSYVTYLLMVASLLVVFLYLERSPIRPPLTTGDAAIKAQTTEAFGRLPLSFEANRGQCEMAADFLARGTGYNLFLTASAATFAPRTASHSSGQAVMQTKAPGWLRMQLKGGNATARARGVEELPGRSHYLVGRDTARWHSDIAQFRQARYDQIYPGIDVVYYGTQGQLEYDFIVAPHADPRAIKLAFAGADEMVISPDGDLILRVAGAEVRQRRPVIYQEVEGARQVVNGGYVQTGEREIGFEIGEYDRAQSLVIDPVILYATFLGGSDTEPPQVMARDAAGNIYVAGRTTSINFPTTAQALRKTMPQQQEDGFIAKLNPAGSALVYATYLGSETGVDEIYGIAVDAAGNAYVTGRTYAGNFPVTSNAAQTTYDGPNQAFVAKLNATGSALLYSTLLGGDGFDEGLAVAADAAGNIYVTGRTTSNDFPTTTNAFQKALGAPAGNAFIVKYSATGQVSYATYYGGGTPAVGLYVTADALGNAFIGGNENNNVFLARLSANGLQKLYSFPLNNTGGAITEVGDMLLDNSGNLYVTGDTSGGWTATAGAVQPNLAGVVDAYVLKLNATGVLTYFTYLGGRVADSASRLALDNSGNIYVVGWTTSADFPVRDAPQPRYAGGGLPFGDGFVAKLNAAGSALVYSTFLGEAGNDYVNDIEVDSAGNAYVIGGTDRGAFPVTPGGWQTSLNGPLDGFIVKLGEGAPGLTNVSAASYLRSGIAPEAIVAAFGPALALGTQAAETRPLPTSLGGTSVIVKDSAGTERSAPLFFVSPNQVNYQFPPGTVPGTALVRVRNANAVQSESISFVERVAPALFTANANGQGVPAALALRVKSNGAQSYEAVAVFDAATNRFIPRPLDFGPDELYLVLFGSGFRLRSQLSAVQIELRPFGLEPALYAGAQGNLVGLDQVNVRLPKSLAGRGEIGVIVRVDGRSSNEVQINLR